MTARKTVPSKKKKPALKKKAVKKKAARSKTPRKWSAKVTRESDALTLEGKVFSKPPRQIALSLKKSAEKSRRRKSTPYRSAMSMLTFYINRGGKNLSAAGKKRLEAAKGELRMLFGRKG